MFHLIVQSFRYYWKSHLGLLFGAFLASAILSGSLVVGDSVRASLRRAAAERLGSIQSAVLGGDRWVTSGLVRQAGAAPVILLNGSVNTASGQARANAVQVIGADDAFGKLSPAGQPVSPGPDGLAVNQSLARKLGVKIGDTLIVRLEKPSAISRDAPLSGNTNEDVTLRKTVSAIVDGDHFGAFQLTASQAAPDSVYVNLDALATVIGKKDRVNTALADRAAAGSLASRLEEHAQLEDYGLKLVQVPGGTGEWDISTDRVFLDDTLVTKLLAQRTGGPDLKGYPVTTYLINEIRSAHGATPYSFATATDHGQGVEASPAVQGQGPQPIIITDWLAADQNLQAGDEVSLSYFTVGDGRKLTEKTTAFKVSRIVAIADLGPGAKLWTPDFPGVSEAKNCRDWQPGIPMKLDKLRPKDEAYWQEFKSIPKAFISLSAGEAIWGNRFGKHTSVRIAAPGMAEAGLRSELGKRLHLADIGLAPRDVRASAAAAAQGSVDFGGLFVGLSLFLIAAALVFASLLFVFTLEKRASQIGLMMAIGWRKKQVWRAILGEAGLVAVLGAALGVLGGIVYTKLALAGLNGVWSSATVGLRLVYDADPATLGIAFGSSVIASLATLWLASRRILKSTPRDLLSGEAWIAPPKRRKSKVVLLAAGASPDRGLWSWGIALILVLSAVGMSIMGGKATDPEEIASLFFTAGFALLAAGLLVFRRGMIRLSRSTVPAHNLTAIGFRNITRRRGRSLSVIGMMAGGLFLVIAVNAFRLGAEADPFRRSAGTGGFALFGQSTLPIYEDLNSATTWDTFALDDKLMKETRVVPIRVRQGDDASCLNLNKAQNPVLMGVNPQALVERKAFSFADGSWEKLTAPKAADGAIPAVADEATALWGLGKGIGDTLTYTDDAGQPFKVRLVGLLAGSILQGNLIIAEHDFLSKFPNAAGYRMFLVDAPPNKAAAISGELTKQLSARGLALEPASQRLEAFSAVQNSYIGIFTVLGGLGVLLGTAGLGVLAARNILERRGEFGLMQALGFRSGALRRMVLSEHAALLIGGIVLGLISAAIAVLPDLRQSGGALPIGFLAALNAGIIVFGFVVCWVAGALALRGKLLDALRRE